jgi:hypothetical protein
MVEAGLSTTVILERVGDRIRALDRIRSDLQRSLIRADALGLSSVGIYVQCAIDELDAAVDGDRDVSATG